MGLHFSHGLANFSYSGFNDLRAKIARDTGFLTEIQEERPGYPGRLRVVYPLKYSGFLSISKFRVFKDPIRWLLDHSDCDGYIPPVRAGKIAARLRNIVYDWADNNHYKDMALKLAKGLQDASDADENFEFK